MRARLLPLILIPLLMAGCATVSTTPAVTPAEQAAGALLDNGKYREAAQAYLQIANEPRSAVRDRALVHAAEAFERAGDGAAARQTLAQSNRRKLVGEDAFNHDLLNAQFLIEDGRGRDALALLGQNPGSVPDAIRWHSLRARAFTAAGQPFDVAIETAALLQPTAPAKERAANARNVERLLAGVDNGTLSARSAALAGNDPLYPFAARELAKRGLPLPHPLDRSAQVRTQAFPPADSDGYRPPLQLAVLLPSTGSLAGAGAGVRDGILAAYYAETRRRPNIKFYDTNGTAAGAQSAAAQANADGAQLILGPLSRDEINAVFAQNVSGAPIIALNRGVSAPPPGSISFALSPDDEGLFAADRLANRGQLKVLVFTQRDDGGQRALAAFREQLRARGGDVVGEVVVDDGVVDVGPLLAAQTGAGHTVPTAVLLVLKAPQARLVAAQLKVSPFSALPRVSTSLILNGANARQDVELDGIEFPELPWLLDRRPDLIDADALAADLGTARGPSQRLFAFGMDAWKLAAYLDRLGTDPGYTLRGATGDLRLDSFGIIQRDPSWAVFSGGRPRAAPDGGLQTNAASATR